MRIISQDGTIDVPYENSMIRRDEESILYVMCGSDAVKITGRLLASYSTSEKAEKAMEMLQNDYYVHVAEKTYHEGAYCIHPYFRFPKDEDLEV